MIDRLSWAIGWITYEAFALADRILCLTVCAVVGHDPITIIDAAHLGRVARGGYLPLEADATHRECDRCRRRLP